MSELKKIMRKNLRKAYHGWWIWHCTVKKYHLGRTKVVLLPSTNDGYQYAALRYVDQMLKWHQYDSVLFLTVDEHITREVASLFSEKILDVVQISRKKAEALMQFYCLYEFDSRFVVASLEEPNGRNAARLIGKNGTTVEELMAIGVYQLPQFLPEAPPDYDGDQTELKQFLTGKAG